MKQTEDGIHYYEENDSVELDSYTKTLAEDIGKMRITPKYEGEWNPNIIYYKQSVVVYEENTYIAKVNKVPIGTLPTNKEYYNLYIDNSKQKSNTKAIEEINKKLKNCELKHIYHKVIVKEEIKKETEYEIPFSFIVGNDEFELFYNNEYLIREKSSEDIANYREVGEIGTISNKVLFGWDISVGQALVFVRKGAVENEENEN